MTKPLPPVHLGYEVGSGAAVEIPVRHTVIVGQTQESGKTTTLEALITRSGFRAVTFVTKRGEASFTGARRVQPYFREQADWQYVAAILEASRGERMKMERSFIIRASKGANTLRHVHANVKRFLADPKIKGLPADMYLCLDAYLDVVVPAIDNIAWADALILHPGVNAVDLTDVPDEMQHLVIQSSIDWVLRHETNTIVVVPEAWKFVPEGRKTPVKQSAVALIRQGAALRNYVWLDSQDIGGISKEILRSCPVWLLGVQREINEIKRTLDNIPEGISKPKKADIATLSIGQFYACWSTHAVKTYVQPAWLEADDAKAVAMGQLAVGTLTSAPHQFMLGGADQVRRFAEAFENAAIIEKPVAPEDKEPTVTHAEADALKAENAKLKADIAYLEKRLDAALAETRPSHQGKKQEVAPAKPAPPQEFPSGVLPIDFDAEGLYQAFKARLISELPSDSSVMRIVTARPELVVEVERKIVTIDGTSLKGRVARLIAKGFFATGATQSATRTELRRTGPDCNTGNLSRAFSEFVKDGFLTDEGAAGYRIAPGVKVSERELTVA